MTKKEEKTKKEKKQHWPTLNTIIMVEETLKKSKEKSKQEFLTVAELKKQLPRQVNHITLMMILEYLEKSKKIDVTLKGISWKNNIQQEII